MTPFNKAQTEISQSQVTQAPNRATVWSSRQKPKSEILKGPRFTQIDIQAQPNPLAAIELIKADPIRHFKERQVICKGDSSLGHPNVFINLVNQSCCPQSPKINVIG